MNNIFNQDFQEYIQALNEFDVEYVLLGGLAVNIHGYRRSTGDMDIFVNPSTENHKKLSKAHAHFGMDMGAMDSLEEFKNIEKYDVHTFGVSPVQIDILTKCKGITFDEAYADSKMHKFENILVRVIHINTLIKAKKAAGRLRDQTDIEELEKIKKENSSHQ